MSDEVKAEIAIFGGGIAGLWLLTRLRQAGFVAILFETEAMGAGQSIKSQGIIHGGMKYALHGKLTTEATAMAAMPPLWRACLRGQGEINLSKVPVLSKTQYLWSPGRFASKITGFLAGMAMRSKVAAVLKPDYPYVFQNEKFKGALYALDEMVLDVPVLISELTKLNQGAIFKIKPFKENALQFDEVGRFIKAELNLGEAAITLMASHIVFAAGEGNEIILNCLKESGLLMQRRPLHMVMVKTPFYFPLYAHCMGGSQRPRLTVTTQRLANGEAVWYLGGLLAEEGVHRNEQAQIKAASRELESLFPWLDFKAAQYATFFVDRAEPKQPDGLKPETVFAKTMNNITVAWPTKLALAPALAAHVLAEVKSLSVHREDADLSALKNCPQPEVAQPMWEQCSWKSAN